MLNPPMLIHDQDEKRNFTMAIVLLLITVWRLRNDKVFRNGKMNLNKCAY